MSALPAYTVDVRRLDEFSALDLYAMLKMRVDVFVVEQNCPYPELDGSDPELSPVPVTALSTIPFHRLRRVYVAAGSAWLRLRDRLES